MHDWGHRRRAQLGGGMINGGKAAAAFNHKLASRHPTRHAGGSCAGCTRAAAALRACVPLSALLAGCTTKKLGRCRAHLYKEIHHEHGLNLGSFPEPHGRYSKRLQRQPCQGEASPGTRCSSPLLRRCQSRAAHPPFAVGAATPGCRPTGGPAAAARPQSAAALLLL